jgi:putative tricarboxylic transport membrane protein
MSREAWSGVLWLSIALYVGRESVRLGVGQWSDPGPGFIFLGSAVVLAALSATILVRGLRRHEPAEPAGERASWRRVLVAFGVLALYVLAFESVGFLLATVIMMVVVLRLGGVRKWTTTMVVAAGATLGTYVLLNVWLQTRLPAGTLEWLHILNR